MAELVDAQVSKTCEKSCGLESHYQHQKIKRFKRQCARNGIIQEIKKREHYEKPSVKRKKKSEAAKKRNRK